MNIPLLPKKNFPQSIHHSTPSSSIKYTRKKYPSSSTIFWTTQFSICHLSSPLSRLKSILRSHLSAIFIHPSNERRCTHSFKHPAPGSRLIEGIDYQPKQRKHHLDPTFSTLDFSNRNRKVRKVRKEEMSTSRFTFPTAQHPANWMLEFHRNFSERIEFGKGGTRLRKFWRVSRNFRRYWTYLGLDTLVSFESLRMFVVNLMMFNAFVANDI